MTKKDAAQLADRLKREADQPMKGRDMFKWITANPIATGIIALAIVVFIITGFAFLSRENAREEENLKSQGATEERNRGNEEILNKVENAVRPASNNELRAECLRNNRNPAACN